MSSNEVFEHLRLPFKVLESATNNFSDTNCIGHGGFGKVYKGNIVLSGVLTMVAVKRLDRRLGQGTTEFWKEIMMLSQYKHENLVSLIGFCVEGGENILVYEYLSNRSLDLYLKSVDLSWHQRLIICLGAAMGLQYLHKPVKGSQQRVLHRDIKSANILLDHNWRAKIADFGLSKVGPANQKYTFLYSNAVGTMGYCDPLYADTGLLTKESDVYSFGVVLFEVLCGRPCVVQKYDDIRRSLTALSRKCYEEKKMHKIIHVSLQDNISSKCLKRFSAIAYQCLQLDRAKRPTMDKVVEELKLALDHQVQDKRILEKHICFLLHGTLHVTIFEVDKIHGYGGGKTIFGKLKASLQNVGSGKGTPKMYATIDLDKCRVGTTSFVENERQNPRWYESLRIYCAHSASKVIFTVKNDNPIGATLIGRAYVPVEDLLKGEEVDRWVEILDEDKNPVEADSKIHVKLQYFDVTQDRNWAHGIKTAKYPGVPYTFFPQRQGCRVSLYQDAHVPDNFIPKIPLAGGKYYEPHRCWEDVFDAISNAKHFIYIAGWSVYTEIFLIRDSWRRKPGGDCTLGELLKYKASEGVTVLMLVWDDRTSVDLLKKDGLMATHGEDTKSFFQGSNVHCTVCPRIPHDSRRFRKGLQISKMFTHNQKIIAVDSPLPNGDSERRRVVSFVGGLDLCDGRYDSPFHSLFRTLDTVHHDDFHQPHYAEAAIAKGGPRVPWHDIHSKLEGLIAWDVLFNFEQRWRKQGGKDFLINVKELDDIIPPSPVMFYDDPESWNVQLFRSIDGRAAFGFPDTPEDADRSGLVCVKDNIIDRSIQDAYIHAIRRAKNFIYIENQYFLGSSFGWHADADDIKVEDVGALHLIPKELSLKIMSKIEAGEKFTVYVVVPMWPEGIPESASVQAILDWQRRTMEMMYKDIVQALNARGIDDDPRDYLTFFCLGNREVKMSGEYEPEEAPKAASNYEKAQEARRFMIYVHGKMMIVDDEYIIVGSANINQRSMDGARDSEIAMGAYQPHHIATRTPPRGQVYGFRMALWYEHIGMLDDSFHHPESTECVKKVNQIADKYWNLYSSENLESDLPGHLLRYPVDVSGEGDVTNLPGSEFFPDTNARILGTKSDYLPSILTT